MRLLPCPCVAVALVGVLMACGWLIDDAVAQNPIFHVSSVRWVSTNASLTTASDFEVRCEHDNAFASDWALGPDLSVGEQLGNGTLYNTTTVALEYNFGGAFTPLSTSDVACVARLTVEGTVRRVPDERNCSVSRASLASALDNEACCTVDWNDGVEMTYCLVGRTAPGYACTLDSQCDGGDCRGGFCCGELGRVPGCKACSDGMGGVCTSCAAPYFLVRDSARRRRAPAVEGQGTFTRARPLPADSDTTTASPAPASNYDIASLPANTCYRDQFAGATCTRNQECVSGKCSGGFCCDGSKYSSACTNCTANAGMCGGCVYGYELNNGACTFLNADGALCGSDDDCATGVCRGGKCCGEKGQSKGCLACDHDGECATCDQGYVSILSECVRDTSTNNGGGNSGSSGGDGSSVSNSTIIAAALGGGLGVIMIAIVVGRYMAARKDSAESS